MIFVLCERENILLAISSGCTNQSNVEEDIMFYITGKYYKVQNRALCNHIQNRIRFINDFQII